MYQQIRSLIQTDLDKVNLFIVDQLYSEVALVESIGHYIVDAGGKRLRPMLVLLAAKACGVKSDQHIDMAAVIEFIHTATLLHDDVVDMSTLRRGRPTVNAQWNNPSSVLVGDFIYSRAFQVLVKIGDMRIMEIMADTTNKIAEGEVLQLISKSNPNSTEELYMQVIQNKTAILFEAAAKSGAILSGADQKTVSAMAEFGLQLGLAFQLIDDALDYIGDAEELGKNVGDDLAEGKSPLPLIYTMANGSSADRDLIQQSLRAESLTPPQLQEVIALVKNSGALEYTQELASTKTTAAVKALEALPDSEYKTALKNLVEFSLNRKT
ncbi:MAG TPA: octaprenyl diphosphate synthase [Gammaproteobacteria bacterium]|nr:octaprenyl diphosphate synthase [Gammaproteobacteria bacterium]